jgi:hypothetical protein
VGDAIPHTPSASDRQKKGRLMAADNLPLNHDSQCVMHQRILMIALIDSFWPV